MNTLMHTPYTATASVPPTITMKKFRNNVNTFIMESSSISGKPTDMISFIVDLSLTKSSFFNETKVFLLTRYQYIPGTMEIMNDIDVAHAAPVMPMPNP